MKLSTRSTYGMRALVELALTSGHGPVSAAVIAKRQELSVAYLEQLLHRLKRQGIVTSIRGPRGGYTLAKEPHLITMAAIVRILDGANGSGNGKGLPAAPKERVQAGAAQAGRPAARRQADSHSKPHAQGIAEAVWRGVHERLMQSLDAVTLQDLCDDVRATAGDPLEHRYVFHI